MRVLWRQRARCQLTRLACATWTRQSRITCATSPNPEAVGHPRPRAVGVRHVRSDRQVLELHRPERQSGQRVRWDRLHLRDDVDLHRLLRGLSRLITVDHRHRPHRQPRHLVQLLRPLPATNRSRSVEVTHRLHRTDHIRAGWKRCVVRQRNRALNCFLYEIKAAARPGSARRGRTRRSPRPDGEHPPGPGHGLRSQVAAGSSPLRRPSSFRPGPPRQGRLRRSHATWASPILDPTTRTRRSAPTRTCPSD